MKVTIQQLKDDTKQERLILGEVRLDANAEDISNPGEWCGSSTIKLLDGRLTEVFVNYAPGNQNFSVTMMFEDRYVFTACCRWGDVPPYFGFGLADGSFIEICCALQP